jgi:hypothetical protein
MNDRFALKYTVLTFLLAFGLGDASVTAAEGPRWVAQILRKLPRDVRDVEAAFEQSRNASLQLSVGEPMEAPDFSQETVFDVTVGGQKQKLKFQFGRLGALTYGMELTAADQANLPAVSKSRIMQRITENYISIQIRPQRDVASGAIYLYYKPFAAIGSYIAPNTQEFAPLMEDSVRNFRGIGLFVKPGAPINAENLRTFVGINKTMITDEQDPDAPKPALFPNFEFTFVRARVEGQKVVLHTFVTNEHRQRLHYLKPYVAPQSPDECSIKSTILFTEYSVAKQSPSAKALRRTWINSQASYPVVELDKYAADQNWSGDAFDNLTELLDAMIDGRFPSPGAATAGAE